MTAPVIHLADHRRKRRLCAGYPIRAVKHDRCAHCGREITPRMACAMVDGTLYCNVDCWIKAEGQKP